MRGIQHQGCRRVQEQGTAMMGLGWQELAIVLVIIMIIFGAGKLPEVARSLGQGVKEFKSEAAAPVDSTGAGGAPAAASRLEEARLDPRTDSATGVMRDAI
jgi:sec-independent protein translocase protein TatA